MSKVVLRSVDAPVEDDPMAAERAWLENYQAEEAALAVALKARTKRPPLKVKVMESMKLWGVSDKMLAEKIITTLAVLDAG